MSSQAIMIRATVDQKDINVCKFTVDRPVHSGAAVFQSKKEAKGNDLAEKLFEIAEISKVEMADNLLTVTKTGSDDWALIGKRIGGFIRSFLQPELFKNMLPVEEVRK